MTGIQKIGKVMFLVYQSTPQGVPHLRPILLPLSYVLWGIPHISTGPMSFLGGPRCYTPPARTGWGSSPPPQPGQSTPPARTGWGTPGTGYGMGDTPLAVSRTKTVLFPFFFIQFERTHSQFYAKIFFPK